MIHKGKRIRGQVHLIWPEVFVAGGGSGSIKAVSHLDVAAHLLDQLSRDFEGFGLP